MDAADLTLLLAAATAAGWVDAVVGGGGPAMLIGAPQIPIATILGTNKLTAIAGTTSAAITYARRTRIDWTVAGPACAAAVIFAGLGAWFASSITTAVFRPAILAALLAVAAFVTFRPAMGTIAHPHKRTPARVAAAIGIAGTAIAFYDGLIGPGTGTFLVLTMTATIGTDFLAGSAVAKVVNAGTNLGARLALRKGASFVRAVLLTVVCGLVAKLGFDMLAG